MGKLLPESWCFLQPSEAPMMPLPGNMQLRMNSPLLPGVKPPALPRPLPGYAPAPGMPPMMALPGAPPFPGQVNGLPRPPTMTVPTGVPGTAVTPTASGATSMVTPVMYRPNSAAPTTGGFDSFNMSAQAPEANH